MKPPERKLFKFGFHRKLLSLLNKN